MPHRFVATTYNLWADDRWPERAEPLRGYLTLTRPDVLCVQELRQATRDLIDQTLPDHARIDDDFEGWCLEGNIYWSTAMFELRAYGAEDLGQQSPLRRLFWARLGLLGTGTTVLVSTAHFTWQGNPTERETDTSPRPAEARRVVAALERLAEPDEPVLFMGDLNDAVNPIRILRDAGFCDSFTASASPKQPTHPVRPTADGNPQLLDWQFHRGPVRAMTSQIGDFFHADLAPSDHRPVTTTYGLDAAG